MRNLLAMFPANNAAQYLVQGCLPVMALDYQPFWTTMATPSYFRQQFLLVQVCINSCGFQRLTVGRTLFCKMSFQCDSNVLYECIFTTKLINTLYPYMENGLWYMDDSRFATDMIDDHLWYRL